MSFFFFKTLKNGKVMSTIYNFYFILRNTLNSWLNLSLEQNMKLCLLPADFKF